MPAKRESAMLMYEPVTLLITVVAGALLRRPRLGRARGLRRHSTFHSSAYSSSTSGSLSNDAFMTSASACVQFESQSRSFCVTLPRVQS